MGDRKTNPIRDTPMPLRLRFSCLLTGSVAGSYGERCGVLRGASHRWPRKRAACDFASAKTLRSKMNASARAWALPRA